MRKLYASIFISFFFMTAFAQAPYLGTAGADGLGQYGYLEKDAVTFTRLFRNTYNNIAYLSARYWITDNNNINGNGKEFIYHVYDGPDWVNGIGWQCGADNDGSKRTTDYATPNFSPEWGAGSDAYVSVCAKYCDDSYSPASFNGSTTNGAVGFNERHFSVLDVDTSLHASTASVIIPSGNGTCQTSNNLNVAGSFSITPGAFTGIALTTLVLRNNGTALEATDIPNAAFNVYYEPATGTELFGDGNETFAGILNGNWDGNTSDNIFGATNLNIPLTGNIRVYVLLCSANYPAGLNKTLNLSIINDGISLAPALDGFTKMRINSGSISQKNITLPVSFISFSGRRNNGEVQLQWKATVTDNNSRFIIQQSVDGTVFTDAASISSNNFVGQRGTYIFSFSTAATYFKIQGIDQNQQKANSNIIRVSNNFISNIQLLSNPLNSNRVQIQYTAAEAIKAYIQLTDMSGKMLQQQQYLLQPGINNIPLLTSAAQVLLLQLQTANGQVYHFKIMKQQ